MRYAVLDGTNAITNLIIGTVPGLRCVPDDGSAQIGGSWNGTAFLPPAAPAPVVPPSVTRFQALAALSNAGLLTGAESAVNAAGGLMLLAWNNAQSFERNSPSIAAIAQALGLTDAQIDALFIAASQISA